MRRRAPLLVPPTLRGERQSLCQRWCWCRSQGRRTSHPCTKAEAASGKRHRHAQLYQRLNAEARVSSQLLPTLRTVEPVACLLARVRVRRHRGERATLFCVAGLRRAAAVDEVCHPCAACLAGAIRHTHVTDRQSPLNIMCSSKKGKRKILEKDRRTIKAITKLKDVNEPLSVCGVKSSRSSKSIDRKVINEKKVQIQTIATAQTI